MNLDTLLKFIDGTYKVLCGGKEIENVDNLSEEKFVQTI